VFLDAGATVEASPDLLASFALVGAAYARVRLGIERPRVGLLTVGEEAGKGDPLRKAAHDALAALPVDFVGNVEGRDVPQGGRADVVVTDGFTGNVLAKGWRPPPSR
jgi:glycerol-3-phosphate acyltransferase PlsX